MNCQTPSVQAAVPSRHSNPFATCWTRPGAAEYLFPEGQSVEQLVLRLEELGWWGEIVGPHGAGKSTLLATLLPGIAAAGRHVAVTTLHASQRRLPTGFLPSGLARPAPLVAVDGYEQLSAFGRRWLRWRCRRAAAGLLVTSHVATGLPTLVRLEPDLDTLSRLVARLKHSAPSPVTSVDVAASHARRGSNVREIMFDLYDRHELSSRERRTARVPSA